MVKLKMTPTPTAIFSTAMMETKTTDLKASSAMTPVSLTPPANRMIPMLRTALTPLRKSLSKP